MRMDLSRLRRLVLTTSLLAGCAFVSPRSVAAQSGRLARAEELTRSGRADEAREVLSQWWEDERDGASRQDIQQGLWLRGRLTVDPVQAELDFSRLLVLYPSGPYAAPALFRLAQSAYARGDGETARSHVAMLARDYPSSDSRSRAEAWLRNAGPLPATVDATDAPRAATSPTPPVSDAPPRTTPSTPSATSPARSGPAFDWSVQFGAFGDEARAFALHEELLDAGLAARLVRVEGSGFLHVRIGRFQTRVEASDQLESVSARGFSAAIIRDDRAEEVVRR